jgi:hypothetical protein
MLRPERSQAHKIKSGLISTRIISTSRSVGRAQVVFFRGFESVLHIFAPKFYDLLPNDHGKHIILILICTDNLSGPHYSCDLILYSECMFSAVRLKANQANKEKERKTGYCINISPGFSPSCLKPYHLYYFLCFYSFQIVLISSITKTYPTKKEAE